MEIDWSYTHPVVGVTDKLDWDQKKRPNIVETLQKIGTISRKDFPKLLQRLNVIFKGGVDYDMGIIIESKTIDI